MEVTVSPWMSCFLCWPKHAVLLLISLVHWSLCQLPVGCCFRLAPSSDFTSRIAKFQMLRFIINTDAQMRKKPTALFSHPKVGLVTGSLRGRKASDMSWVNGWDTTHTEFMVQFIVTFSAENEEASSLTKSRGLPTVLYSRDDKITWFTSFNSVYIKTFKFPLSQLNPQ